MLNIVVINDNNIDEPNTSNETVLYDYNDHLEVLVTANVSNNLTYHQLTGTTQSQLTITINPNISQILQSNIPSQIFVGNNTISFDINHLAQFYSVLANLLTTYSPFDGDIYTQPDQVSDDDQEFDDTEAQPIKSFNNFYDDIIIHKHLFLHDDLQEIKPIILSPEFILRYNDFHNLLLNMKLPNKALITFS